jgi:hypothetical protein
MTKDQINSISQLHAPAAAALTMAERYKEQIGAKDARIEELKKVLRDECFVEVGHRQEQWLCIGCSCYGDNQDSIKHADDCNVAKAIGIQQAKVE